MSKEYEWIKLEKGIRCRKHPTRKHGIKADVYYVLRFSVDGKMVQEALGWASEGMTLARARVELAKLREAKRSGLGARSLREKRQKAEAERRAEEKATAEIQENLPEVVQILCEDFRGEVVKVTKVQNFVNSNNEHHSNDENSEDKHDEVEEDEF